MSAVGKIDILAVVIGGPQKLLQQASESNARAAVLPAFAARISDPPAKPHVKQRHQESQSGIGVGTHVRAYRGARNRHGRPDGDALFESRQFGSQLPCWGVGSFTFSLVRKGACESSKARREC